MSDDRGAAPGVYVEEGGSGPPPIAGAETGVLALVGAAAAGPAGRPRRVTGMAEFVRRFGAADSPLGRAAALFFTNGGRAAVIVRAAAPAGAGETAAALAALRGAEFDLLHVLPPVDAAELPPLLVTAALARAAAGRALALFDPPAGWTSVAAALAARDQVPASRDAAVWFPRLRLAAASLAGPAAAVAGVIARTDAERGVWKAPAGIDARLRGIVAIERPPSDAEIGQLNPCGINALREARGAGPVVWGARTRAAEAEWKYIPVRRTALFLERSLVAGLGWAVFEPNGAALWTRVQASVENFLVGLWRQGAFPGATPAHALYVAVGLGRTMTQDDIDNGRLIIEVGFAALKPAEFVVVRIALAMAGR